MIPASGKVSFPSFDSAFLESWELVSDSESEELLKSIFSKAVEEGAMMEGKMIPSPSSGPKKGTAVSAKGSPACQGPDD